MRETNRRFAERCARDPLRLAYVDVATPMLGKDGRPRPELFLEDRLHLNDGGIRPVAGRPVGPALAPERKAEKRL